MIKKALGDDDDNDNHFLAQLSQKKLQGLVSSWDQCYQLGPVECNMQNHNMLH